MQYGKRCDSALKVRYGINDNQFASIPVLNKLDKEFIHEGRCCPNGFSSYDSHCPPGEILRENRSQGLGFFSASKHPVKMEYNKPIFIFVNIMIAVEFSVNRHAFRDVDRVTIGCGGGI